MLTVTRAAALAIDHLLAAQGIRREDGGLHLMLDPLSIEVLARADPDDDIIDTAGTQVFLDRETRIRLADKVLDIAKEDDDHLAFVVVSPEAVRRRVDQRRKATSG
jgi:hypothetical protein